jgi:hypothetical protein
MLMEERAKNEVLTSKGRKQRRLLKQKSAKFYLSRTKTNSWLRLSVSRRRSLE